MLGRIARLHYEHGYTHQQIADALGLSRVKVTRMLAEARRRGIVEIRIHTDETIFTELEVELSQRYGLTSAWVAPTANGRDDQLDALGILGASAMQSIVGFGMTVAVGLSETVARIAPNVHVDSTTGALFIAATGNRLGAGEWTQPGEAARSLASAFGGRWQQLPAPMVASSQQTADLIKREPDVASALSLARQADIAVFGVGGVLPGAGFITDDPTSMAMLRQLASDGAVGNISAGFFDEQGSPISNPLNERIIGITLTELEAIPVRVAIAGGEAKGHALLGVLNGGYATILVTDEKCARRLLAAN